MVRATDLSKPWDWVWGEVLKDADFGRTELKEPALLILARVVGGAPRSDNAVNGQFSVGCWRTMHQRPRRLRSTMWTATSSSPTSEERGYVLVLLPAVACSILSAPHVRTIVKKP